MEQSINIFIIHLRKNIDRYDYIQNGIKNSNINANFHIWDAWDGNNINTDKTLSKYFSKVWSYRRYKNIKAIAGQKGCLLSHIQCMNYCLKHNINNAIILEDDVDFSKLNNNSINVPTQATGIYYLGSSLQVKGESTNYILPIIEKPVLLDTSRYKLWGTYGYYLLDINSIYNKLLLYSPCSIDVMFTRFIQPTNKIYYINIILTNTIFKSDVTFTEKYRKKIRPIFNLKMNKLKEL